MASYTSTCTLNNISCNATVSFLETVYMQKRLPVIMQSNDFWTQFAESCNTEISEVINTIKDKSELFVIEKMEYDRLLEIVNLINLPFDASIDSTVEFLRREIFAVRFKLQYKSTAILYKSLYKALDRTGQIYVYYYNGVNIIRSSKSILYNDATIDRNSPWTHLSEENFTGFLEEDLLLDDDQVLDLGWSLDTKISKTNTKHFSIEYTIDELLENSEGKKYTILNNYLNYLYSSANIFKRVVEVSHVGLQINAITDNSQNVNEITSIETKCLVTSNFNQSSFIAQVKYMKFGINKHTDIDTTEPTDVGTCVAKLELDNDQIYSTTDYVSCVHEYPSQFIQEEFASLSLITLTYPEIRKKSITLKLTYKFIDYEISESNDKFVYIFPDNESIEGTINYTTGSIIFTDFPLGITNISFNYLTYLTQEINEAGIFDDNNNLLAYATFPPAEFKEQYYHLSMGFIIKRSSF